MYKDTIQKLKKIFYIFPLLIFFLPGCTKYVHVKHSAFTNRRKIFRGFPVGSTFHILPVESDNQLFVYEIKDKIQSKLAKQYYYIASANNADYYLSFSFGIDKSKSLKKSWEYLPGDTTETKKTLYDENGQYKGSSVEKSETSGTFIPTTQEVVSYNRYLTITVFDADAYRTFNREEQVWHTTVESTGSSSDLRLIVDYLLKSAFTDFGKNTHGTEKNDWVVE